MSADKSDCGLIAVCLRQNECSNPLPSPCRHGRMRRSVSVILRTTAMHDMIAHPRMSAPPSCHRLWPHFLPINNTTAQQRVCTYERVTPIDERNGKVISHNAEGRGAGNCHGINRQQDRRPPEERGGGGGRAVAAAVAEGTAQPHLPTEGGLARPRHNTIRCVLHPRGKHVHYGEPLS